MNITHMFNVFFSKNINRVETVHYINKNLIIVIFFRILLVLEKIPSHTCIDSGGTSPMRLQHFSDHR
jgi:hypothetical protein